MLLPAGECLEFHGAQADSVLPGAHGLPLHLWGAPGRVSRGGFGGKPPFLAPQEMLVMLLLGDIPAGIVS